MVKEKLSKSLKFKFYEIFLVIGIGALIIFFMKPIAKNNPIVSATSVWIANIVMLAIVLIGMKLRGETLKNFGFSLKFKDWKSLFKTILWSLFVFALILFGFAIASSVMSNILETTGSADLIGYKYVKDNTNVFIISLIAVLVASSFAEEVIYRAFLINRINELGVEDQLLKTAIVASAIIFGLAHFSWGPMGIIQTMAVGFVLSVCYIKLNKRLWILILAHAYIDIILMTKMYLG
jgi:membrane protease YdiL (CAAX protease family)